MVEKPVGYEFAGRAFEGMLIYDGTIKRRRPGLFLQPNWRGITQDNIAQAGTIAGTDFVVLLADMFGVGYGTKSIEESERFVSARQMHEELDVTLACGETAFKALTQEARAAGVLDEDSGIYGAGFCLGAGVLLDQLRAGLPIEASALFHITYPLAAQPKEDSRLRSRCLIMHGADDPITSKADIDALEDELMEQRVDWQTVVFANTLHAFTDSNLIPGPVARYDERACLKSYALMRDFFLKWRPIETGV